jgi:hypothetical protein
MTAGQDAREAQWLKWRSVADLYWLTPTEF